MPETTSETLDSVRGYHHGDLRRTLLRAARELLVERGVTGFSLREVARRAGVSPRAPYHHFPDRIALLAEVAREGFSSLTSLMAAEMAIADPEERLRALGAAYLRFAVENPADFQTMHCDELCSLETFPDRPDVAEGSFGYLFLTLQELAGRPLSEPEGRRIGLVAWAAVHGLATLRSEGVLRTDFPDDDLDDVVAEAVARTARMLVTELRRPPAEGDSAGGAAAR
jgi:AcrR family transcriptional regulator